MTDLLSRYRPDSPPVEDRAGSPATVLAGVLAALSAAGTMLLVVVAVALAGWFGADAGRYGDTRDAVRVGADAWLLAHGSGLQLRGATVTALPLGLTLLCGWTVHRSGRWAARRAGLAGADVRVVLALTAVLASAYAVVALVVAVLAAHPVAQPGVLRAGLGALLLAGFAGGTGVLAASGHARTPAGPAWLRAVPTGAATTVLLLLAAGSVLVAAALIVDFGTAATVLSRLHADDAGGLMYTVVGAAFVPNAVALATTYLLGPGFAVGTGTLVSPTAVMLGPVPAFPLLAALPDDGATPAWTTGLLAVPVVLAAVGAVLAGRLAPVSRYDHGALRGLAIGLGAALLVTLVAALAGGAAGPGRMADVGAPVLDVLGAAAVSLGAGGLIGGLVSAWWGRRR